MPEIKHTFTAGKMNKDLDERLVPNGEYRDAMNIQVRTTDSESDGGAAGTVQNLKGNKKIAQAFYTRNNYSLNGMSATGSYLQGGEERFRSKMIASIADEKNNVAYFFCASPVPKAGLLDIPAYFITTAYAEELENLANDQDFTSTIVKFVDSIIEVNPQEESSQPIFVDIAGVTGHATEIFDTAPNGTTTPFVSFKVKDDVIDQLKPGMKVYLKEVDGTTATDLFLDDDGEAGVEIIQVKPSSNDVYLATSQTCDASGDCAMYFVDNERTLNFSVHDRNISNSISIIDNLLFWTDGNDEPKKINIDRCKAGTIYSFKAVEPDFVVHEQTATTYLTNPKNTKLVVKDANNDFVFINEVENVENSTPSSLIETLADKHTFCNIKKENITVIRKKPTTPVTLDMRATDREGLTETTIQYPFINPDSGLLVGGFVSTYSTPADLDNDDIINIAGTDTDNPSSPEQTYLIEPGDEVATVGSERYVRLSQDLDVRINDILTFKSTQYGASSPVVVQAQVIEGPIFPAVDTNGYIVKCVFVSSNLALLAPDTWDVQVEPKAPLFETKFGRFGYRYKYEDGECSAFSPWSELAFLPGEFLYNSKEGFNNGMSNNIRKLDIKGFIPHDSIRPLDVRTVDILFKTTDDQNVYVIKSVTRERDNEWEDFVLPYVNAEGEEDENPENFGRLTITSEMINRVLPANQLLRTWDNVPKTALAQDIVASRIVYGNYNQGYDIEGVVGLKQVIVSDAVNFPFPQKSVKSMRTYKWGMVFGDKYGRETPVLASSFKTDSGETITGDASVEKTLCDMANKFVLEQAWNTQPDDWIDYVKYYVKEVSNEYYNLVMDRHFDSGDGGIWLSFNSADRNKVDEETYLILKNEHGTQSAVKEEARYKILSIKNEAPDHIKIKRKNLGRVEINRGELYDGNDEATDTNNGIPNNLLQNPKRLQSQNFGDFVSMSDFKGTAKVRVVGEYTSDNESGNVVFRGESPFRTIATIFGGNDTNPNFGGVTLAKAYDISEVNMYTQINNQLANVGLSDELDITQVDDETSSDYIHYFLEFFDETVFNGPEFDGKFFVKVKRDSTIETKVTKNQGLQNYSILETFDIGYIANFQNNQAASGANSGAAWSTIPNSFSSADIQAEVESPVVTNINASGVSIPGPEPGGVDLTGPSLNSVPNFGTGDFEKTKAFWEHWGENAPTKIFLDRATPAFIPYDPIDGQAKFKVQMFGLGVPYGPMAPFFGGGFEPVSTTVVIDGTTHIAGVPTGFETQFSHPTPSGVVQGSNQPNVSVTTTLHGGFRTQYNPAGLSVGFAQDGKFGQMTFSCVNNIEPQTVEVTGQGGDVVTTYEVYDQFNDPGPIQDFKTYMTTPGTTFKFAADPNQKVYRVLSNAQNVPNGTSLATYDALLALPTDNLQGDDPTYAGSGAYDASPLNPQEHPQVNSIQNFYNPQFTEQENKNFDYALRSSIIVRFAEVGQLNETIPDTGIDVDAFDPRGLVTHNGLSSFEIQIVQVDDTATEDETIIDEGVETTAACWETEPKKNVDIDIYYEASPAIPMFLNKNNIASYVQPSTNPAQASKFYSNYLVDENNYQYLNLPEDAYVSRTYGDDIIEVRHNVSESTTDPNISLPGSNLLTGGSYALPIGAFACFDRLDGFETKSKIIDYYQKGTDAVPGMLTFKPSNRVLLTPTNTALGGAALDGGNTQNNSCIYVNVEDNTTEIITATTAGGNYFNSTAGPGGASVLVSTTTTAGEGQVAGSSLITSLVIGSTSEFNEFVPLGTIVTSVQEVNINGYGQFTKITLSKALTADLDSGLPSDMTFAFPTQTGIFKIDKNVWKYPTKINWFNCYSFGNGVESDRIRDDFNAPQIDNGCRVSSTFLEYGEEQIGSGLIHSGLYNSSSSINNLNEFNMAEKITKNINPAYGSIQALKARQNNIVVFAEDKVLKVLADKDAVFNADGNPQLVATNRVLGQAIPFVGDYGISKNPESLAVDNYRMYFTDKARGAVLRLSMDGLTPISNVGMRSFFRDELKLCDDLTGTFDIVAGEYNLSLYRDSLGSSHFSNVTRSISFNEAGKGWVSFKSFLPSTGVSVNGYYMTTMTEKVKSSEILDQRQSSVFVHHVDNSIRNKFYSVSSVSTIEVVFNDLPSLVKSFKSVSYEGSQGKTFQNLDDTNEFYNIFPEKGWCINSFKTDMQEGHVYEFIEKENSWFNYITSETDGFNEQETKQSYEQLAVQGLGNPLVDSSDTQTEVNLEIDVPQPLGAPVLFWNKLMAGTGAFQISIPEEFPGVEGYTLEISSDNGFLQTLSDFFNDVFLFPSSYFNPNNQAFASLQSISGLPNYNHSGQLGPGVFTFKLTDAIGQTNSITITISADIYNENVQSQFVNPE